MEGRKKESSPIQLGEGTSALRQGFIQKGFVPLWIKENVTPLQPVCFRLVYR